MSCIKKPFLSLPKSFFDKYKSLFKACGSAALFLTVSSSLRPCLRRPGRRHRHRGPLADRHEGRRLSHWLLVQPRALLLDVQQNDFPGSRQLPTVAELGRANNRDVNGRRRFCGVGFVYLKGSERVEQISLGRQSVLFHLSVKKKVRSRYLHFHSTDTFH